MSSKFCIGALLTLCLGTSHFAVAQAESTAPQKNQLELTLPETRLIAQHALRSGKFNLAQQLATGLLKADPEDNSAYEILINAHIGLGNPDLARAAARLNYKYSGGEIDSFTAARTAGQLAFSQKRNTAAQIWLRRAALHSPDDRYNKQLARDYSKVRSANPLNFRLNLSVSPSENVNNGANSQEYLINGEPQLGSISASSQALSGIIVSTDLGVTYRLRKTRTSRTSINTRIFTRKIALSSEARDQLDADPFASDLSNSDLSSTYVDIGLSHSFLFKNPSRSATVRGSIGQTWFGGDKSYSFGKVSFSPRFKLNKSTSLTLEGGLEQRLSAINDDNDSVHSHVSATIRRKLKNGDSLSFGLTFQDVSSDGRNIANQSGIANVNYVFGKQVGPVKLSAGLSIGYTDFTTFSAISAISGGRSDNSVSSNVTMVFNNFDVAGFAPSLQIRAGRSTSNISRYETDEFSVSLGIRSKF